MDAVDSTATRDEGGLGTVGPGTTPGDGGRAELTALTLPQLRRRRDLLGAELRRVGHWRRLLRARRDLLTAAAVAPEALTVPVEAGAAHGPLETHLRAVALADRTDHAGRDGLPADPGHDLADLVLLAPGCGGIGTGLTALTAADRRLAAYTEALAGELELATEVLVARVRAEVCTRGVVEVRTEIEGGA